jgi:hypothetical protein
MVGGSTTVRGEELFEAGCLFCVHILQGLDIIIKYVYLDSHGVDANWFCGINRSVLIYMLI